MYSGSSIDVNDTNYVDHFNAGYVSRISNDDILSVTKRSMKKYGNELSNQKDMD